MTTTSSKFFDEVAKVMTNAAGAAQGVRREVDTLVKSQVERVLGDLDVVQREEFEAVRAMAQKAREENGLLSARITELEARLAPVTVAPRKPAAKKPAAKKKSTTTPRKTERKTTKKA